MRGPRAVQAKLLLALALLLTLFTLCCGLKDTTVEVHPDGSGRTIYIVAVPKTESETEAPPDEDTFSEIEAAARASGGQVLPYTDADYTGNQYIYDFDSFYEIPGQITTLFESTEYFNIQGQHEANDTRHFYNVTIDLQPGEMWYGEDPMSVRVVMPAPLVHYTDIDDSRARTQRINDNTVLWEFKATDDTTLRYHLVAEAEQDKTIQSTSARLPALIDNAVLIPILLIISGVVLTGALVALVLVWRTTKQHSPSPKKSASQKPTPRAPNYELTPEQANAVTPPDHPPARQANAATLQKLGPYKIERLIRRARLITLYQATLTPTQRQVTLTTLAPGLTNDPDFARHFHHVSQRLMHLSHPNLVTVYDAGQEEDLYYLATEYIAGRTLAEHMEKATHPLNSVLAIEIALTTARALAYAHAQGIVHQDLQPTNVLFAPQRTLKIAGLGLAKLIGPETLLREETPGYKAPEQTPGYADVRSDVYALGAILYEMVTQQRPPAWGKRPLLSPDEINTSLPQALTNLILHALHPDPKQRFQSAQAMADALQTL